MNKEAILAMSREELAEHLQGMEERLSEALEDHGKLKLSLSQQASVGNGDPVAELRQEFQEALLELKQVAQEPSHHDAESCPECQEKLEAAAQSALAQMAQAAHWAGLDSEANVLADAFAEWLERGRPDEVRDNRKLLHIVRR